MQGLMTDSLQPKKWHEHLDAGISRAVAHQICQVVHPQAALAVRRLELHVLVSLDSLMAKFEPPPLISKMVIAQRMSLHNDVLKSQLQLNPTVKAKYCSADPEYPALKSTKENATLLRQWISTIFCLQAQPRWEGALSRKEQSIVDKAYKQL